MAVSDIIGFAAASLTTAAFIPQAHLVWKTKRTDGISLGMYLIFAIGVSLWLVYGLIIGSWPIIIANAITVALTLFILVMKLRYK